MGLQDLILSGDVLGVARAYVQAGLSVIPVRADGSKAPAEAGWRAYSGRLALDPELEAWFAGPGPVGVGVVPGAASGNLAILDLEHKGSESVFEQWAGRLPAAVRRRLLDCPIVSTPSGGRHVWVRLPEPQDGCRLARYAGGQTKIEVRGDGHQVLAPGCPAVCHASRRLYEFVNWGWLGDGAAAPLDWETWYEFLEAAAACNEYSPKVAPAAPARSGVPGGDPLADDPGTDFNRRASWADTGLFAAGWVWERMTGADSGFLRRPGKERGISASAGQVTSAGNGWPLLWCWTTNGHPFVAEQPYSKFAAYAWLNHGGDFSAAARALLDLGYGKARSSPAAEVRLGELPPAGPAPGPAAPQPPARPFKWLSELAHAEANDKWIWHGYLSRGGVTLLSALWKAGKSTLLSHLLKHLDGRHEQFLGLPIQPARVLYVTEEHEELWAERRDELGLGDHVGMICRPFRGRPSPAQWVEFTALLKRTAEEHRFDVVVMDTISKLWPVRDENDAGPVEEALMHLWRVTDAGAALLLVHHDRKGQGDEFTGMRGSGGLPAFAETLVEFRRSDPKNLKDAKRVLKGGGRYRETPTHRLIELTPAGYVSHGDPDDLPPADRQRLGVGDARGREVWQAALLEVLPAFGTPAMAAGSIQANLKARLGHGVRLTDLYAHLDALVRDKVAVLKGTGGRGSPFRWTLGPKPAPEPDGDEDA